MLLHSDKVARTFWHKNWIRFGRKGLQLSAMRGTLTKNMQGIVDVSSLH